MIYKEFSPTWYHLIFKQPWEQIIIFTFEKNTVCWGYLKREDSFVCAILYREFQTESDGGSIYHGKIRGFSLANRKEKAAAS